MTESLYLFCMPFCVIFLLFILCSFNLLIFVLHYAIIPYYVLETCSFLRRDRKRVVGTRGREELGEAELGNCNQSI